MTTFSEKPNAFSSFWGHVGVTFSSFLDHVGVTFSSFLDHVGICLGILWGRFRMGLGGFREKVPEGSTKTNFQKMPGSIFPAPGCQS